MKRLSDDVKALKDIVWSCDHEDSKVSCPMPVTEMRYEIAVARRAEQERDKEWQKWGQGMCPHNEPSADAYVPRGGCERCWAILLKKLAKEEASNE